MDRSLDEAKRNPGICAPDPGLRFASSRLRSFKILNLLPLDSGVIEWFDFPEPLEIGEVRLVAIKAQQGLLIPQGATISIRFRKGGEHLFWHGQNKQLKKLFQEWGIPTWQRSLIPLLYVDEQLASVVGYAISDHFYCPQGRSWVIASKNINGK
jgi:tRNA(Ile)-lysidine synthetase-like protein